MQSHSLQDDESHWNSSDIGSFAFDFDDSQEPIGSSSPISSGPSAGVSFKRSEVESEVPLTTLISEKSIFLLIYGESIDAEMSNNTKNIEEEVKYLRRQVKNRWQTPSVKTTISRMLFHQPVSLELFRSFTSKKALLEEAISVGDGETVLSIVLYLSNSLKKSLFNQLLKKYPVAVNQYASYLSTKMQIQELSDLYIMLGRTKDAAIKNFQYACLNSSQQISRLRHCLSNHFSDSPDKHNLENFIKLLEWQKTVNPDLFRKSAIESLTYACQHHWNDQKSITSNPSHLVKELGLTEKQLQWSTVKGRAAKKSWDDIENLIITKTWLGGKRVNAYLAIEDVIRKLHAAGAPSEVLLKYFNLLSDVDARIRLATSLQCDKIIIDSLTCHRDQQALIHQKAQSPTHSKIYSQADSVLRSFATKWKG
nr:PREDICTED: spermatogenesis-defective protein 39 homolog [Bemisia tabaci]